MTIEWLSHVHAKLGQPDHAVNSVPFHRPPPTKTAGVSRGRGAAVFHKQRGRVIDWAPCLLALVLPERPPPPGGFCCFNAGVALEGGGGARAGRLLHEFKGLGGGRVVRRYSGGPPSHLLRPPPR